MRVNKWLEGNAEDNDEEEEYTIDSEKKIKGCSKYFERMNENS